LMHEPKGQARRQVRNDLHFTKRAIHTHAAGQSWQIGWPRPCASDNDTSVYSQSERDQTVAGNEYGPPSEWREVKVL